MEKLIEELSRIRDVVKRRSFLKSRGFSKTDIEKILEQVHLSVKGKKKFPRADQMKFDRIGLAQATSKYVAEYRTWKMRQQLGIIHRVLDIGSGIGGDTIALGLRWKVVAVENNPETMNMLKHNIGVYNLEKNVDFVEGDINELLGNEGFRDKVKDVNCIFFDPDRRKGDSRTVKIEEYEPPLSLVEKLGTISPNVCVKISPGVNLDYIHYDCDFEVVSYKGEVKEVVLWFGNFKLIREQRSIIATKLPEQITW